MWITLKDFDKAKRIGNDFTPAGAGSINKSVVVVNDKSSNLVLIK